MGLDMSLNAKMYLGFGNELGEKIKNDYPVARDFAPKYLTMEAIYWRKANAIHGWFVKNIQNDVDDCGEYPVEREQLAELAELCERVLGFRHLATDLLPPTSGFFFGGTDIDEGYWEDLKYTLTEIRKILEDKRLKMAEFTYGSSW